jgi:hypothetical protein
MAKPNPNKTLSKKMLYVVTFSYIIGTLLLILVTTDLFTVNPFQARYALLFLLIAVNTFFVARQWKLYNTREKAK